MKRYVVVILLTFASPAFAQITTPTWEQFQALEERVLALENADSPSPPPTTFSDRCDMPGVVFCESFDVALGLVTSVNLPQANVIDAGQGSIPPTISDSQVHEGTGALEMTTDGGVGPNVSGSVGFSFDAGTGPVHVNWRMRFGDGYNANKATDNRLGANGEKHMVLFDGPAPSCTNQSVVVSDIYQRGFWQMYYACSPDVREPADPGLYDLNPKVGVTPTCTYVSKPAGCVMILDDHWYDMEMAHYPGGKGRVKLWVDGVLVIDWIGTTWDPPYDSVRIMNYITGFTGGHGGEGVYGDGLWRIWYDSLVVSTECISVCDG